MLKSKLTMTGWIVIRATGVGGSGGTTRGMSTWRRCYCFEYKGVRPGARVAQSARRDRYKEGPTSQSRPSRRDFIHDPPPERVPPPNTGFLSPGFRYTDESSGEGKRYIATIGSSGRKGYAVPDFAGAPACRRAPRITRSPSRSGGRCLEGDSGIWPFDILTR